MFHVTKGGEHMCNQCLYKKEVTLVHVTIKVVLCPWTLLGVGEVSLHPRHLSRILWNMYSLMWSTGYYFLRVQMTIYHISPFIFLCLFKLVNKLYLFNSHPLIRCSFVRNAYEEELSTSSWVYMGCLYTLWNAQTC